MAPALDDEQVAQGNEHIRDFTEAWHLCGERAQGRAASAWCVSPRRLDYAYICSLGSHLERVFGLVPAGRVLTTVDVISQLPTTIHSELRDFFRPEVEKNF